MNNVSNKNDDYIIIAERRYNDVKAEIMEQKIYASRHYVWCPKCKKRMSSYGVSYVGVRVADLCYG